MRNRHIAATFGLVILIGAGGATILLSRQERDTASFDEQVEAISYEGMAPYFDARLVYHADGRLYECVTDNFDKLPDDPMKKTRVWLAREATIKARNVTVLGPSVLGKGAPGTSPWGLFETRADLREKMEPILEETKQEYLEIIRRKRAKRSLSTHGESDGG